MSLAHKHEIGDVYIYNNKKYRVVGVSVRHEHNEEKKQKRFSVWYKVYCYECGGIFITDNKHIERRGCPICNGTKVYEGINDIPTTSEWMTPYFIGGYNEAKLYTKSSNTRIQMICPDCGQKSRLLISPSRLNKTHSIGCFCSNSIKYPERIMYSLLNQLQMPFIYHAGKEKIGFLTSKEYDFYLPQYNCIIETHGRQHYEGYNNAYWGTYEEIHKNDLLKEYNAKQHNISNYVIIDCQKSELQWIKNNILISDLPKLLSFSESDIDWLKCEEEAQTNLIKEVCEYYNNNYENLSAIGNYFLLHRHTIHNYLKKGNILKWCNYNENNNPKYPCVVVYDFKNNTPLIMAKNVQYLAHNSVQILGTKLNAKNIIRCLSGERHSYYGYYFKYYRTPPELCWEANKNGYIKINGGEYNGYSEFTNS